MTDEQTDLDEMLKGFLDDAGEDVTYNGFTYKALLDHDPGEHILLDAGIDPRAEKTVLIRKEDLDANSADPAEREDITIESVLYRIVSVHRTPYSRTLGVAYRE